MRFVYQTPLARPRDDHLLDKGADQLVWLAGSSPGQDWEPGFYYERRRIAATNPQAADPELARALWDRSAELVGLVTA